MPRPQSCCPRGLRLAPAPDGSCAQITGRFLRGTTLHGLHYMGARPQSCPRRLLWGLAFLLSLSLLGAWSSDRVRYLLSSPVHSRVRLEPAPRLRFPAVTLCNNNPVRFRQLTRPDLYAAGQWLGLAGENRSLLPGLLEALPEAQRHWLSRLANYSRFLPPRRAERTLASLLHRLGHQLPDMLLACRFQGQACGPQHFTPVYTRYGKCYTFNGDPSSPRTARQRGAGHGLELMLDIQQEEYLPIWRETNETSFEAGIRVQIHSQEEPPYIHQLGFGVSPGFQTFVSCQEQRLTYLPQPWGNCRASVPGEQILPGYEGYSIAACRLQCEREAVVSTCHCRMVHMPGNESLCSPNVYIECADRTLDAAVEDSQELCSCPTPCNLTRYGKEISMVRIPNKSSARYLARKYQRNETYIRENFLVLDIFFEALSYEAIEQKKAYELAGLLGESLPPPRSPGTSGGRWGCSSAPVSSPSWRSWTTSTRCSGTRPAGRCAAPRRRARSRQAASPRWGWRSSRSRAPAGRWADTPRAATAASCPTTATTTPTRASSRTSPARPVCTESDASARPPAPPSLPASAAQRPGPDPARSPPVPARRPVRSSPRPARHRVHHSPAPGSDPGAGGLGRSQM